MFYTNLARIASAIILFLGSTRVLTGFIVAGSDNPQLGAELFLGRHTSGEAIDQGFLYILIAITLGVLVEISMVLHKKPQKTSIENKKHLIDDV